MGNGPGDNDSMGGEGPTDQVSLTAVVSSRYHGVLM